MKNLVILVAALGFQTTALGADNMTAENICERFTVDAEVFVYDKSGKKLLRKMPESRSYRVGGTFRDRKQDGENVCFIQGQWSSVTSAFDGPLFISHRWEIKKDGTIATSVEQFASEEKVGGDSRDYKFKDSLQKTEFEVNQMTPLVWVSPAHKKEKVVVRFTPGLSAESSPEDISQVPIAGEDILITDTKGSVWADDLYLDGTYVGITSYKGTLKMSFYPFEGAKKIGVARGKDIELSLPGAGLIRVKSKTNFVPSGVAANVYASYAASPKTSRLSSQHIFTSSDKDEFESK